MEMGKIIINLTIVECKYDKHRLLGKYFEHNKSNHSGM